MATDPFGVGYPPPQIVSSGADLEGLSPQARKMLQGIAETYGKPLKALSGYRSPARNRRAGGAKRSQHMHGNAVDLSLDGLDDKEKAAVLAAAIQSGAKGIGIYPGGSLHVDTRENPALWGMRPGAAYSGMPVDMAPSWAQPALQSLYGGPAPDASMAMAYAPEMPPERPVGAMPGQGSMDAPPDFAQQYQSGPMAPPPAWAQQQFPQPAPPQGAPAQAAEQMVAGAPGGMGGPAEVTVRPDAPVQGPPSAEMAYSEMVGHPVFHGGGGNYYFDDPLSGRSMPVNPNPQLLALVNAIRGGGNAAG